MQYAYQKLMEQHELTYSELPEDAKTGIDVIKDVEKAIKMAQGRGAAISEKTYNKLKVNDKTNIGFPNFSFVNKYILQQAFLLV